MADRKVEQATNPRSIRKWQLTADLMAFMAGTGCRIGEARMVTWDDVDLTKQRVRVRGTKTTGSDRMDNLPEWLTDRLLRRRRFMATWEYNTPYVFSMGRPLEVELSDGQLVYPGPTFRSTPPTSHTGCERSWTRPASHGRSRTPSAGRRPPCSTRPASPWPRSPTSSAMQIPP